MKIEEYRSLLGRLPIKTPTPRDMAALCPHLALQEALEAFKTSHGFVALPPVRVRGAFQIAFYHPEWIDGAKNHPAQLGWAYAGRTPESYSPDKPHSYRFLPYKYVLEATRFAEKNWDDELILDSWASVLELYVQDPSDLVNDRYHKDSPRTRAVLYIALNRDFNEIVNDRSKPQSELLDDAVEQMTLDRRVWSELKGARSSIIGFNCAHCGGGLSLSSCETCGHRFHDNGSRSGWDRRPLSRA